MATRVYQNINKKAKNKNAKYKLKYTYSQNITTADGVYAIRYNYSKLISSLSTNKYYYAI